jgi:DNA gyrase/topoisomerase IV subunit B
MASNKEIKVLSEREHILLRPTVYVGSVNISDEKLPILKENKLFIESRPISVGMYKLFDEVFSNSLDEAKRMKGKMRKIKIEVESNKNLIRITDTGNGFFKGSQINKKTGKSNIETAVSQLRAGSNFENENTQESLVGTNGMGVSLVNVLSLHFKIKTTNTNVTYTQGWNNFKRNEPKITKGRKTKGTSVEFVPLEKVFHNNKWSEEILFSTLVLKNELIKRDDTINKLSLEFYWDGEKKNLDYDFLPVGSYKIDTPIGQLSIWEKYEGSGSLSFVNSAMCTGIHQKILNDIINDKLDDSLGHHFYDCLLVLNLPPKLVKFGDQNKTKYVTSREDIEPTLNSKFSSKVKSFFKTDLFKSILSKVEERKNDGYVKKIRSEKRKINLKKSHKYFPAQKRSAENLFIVEGLSAMGSILQKRDPKNDGVYALKGKIKNCKNLGDLSKNREILEIMNILGLDPSAKMSNINGYKKIVIATDPDPDGAHIASLLINLFYKWFPHVVKTGKLSLLKIPLVTSGNGKTRKYYWDLEDFKKSKTKSSVRYLKGLGSLSMEDWEWVMGNKNLVKVTNTDKSLDSLEMAFGSSADARKKWLSGSV